MKNIVQASLVLLALGLASTQAKALVNTTRLQVIHSGFSYENITQNCGGLGGFSLLTSPLSASVVVQTDNGSIKARAYASAIAIGTRDGGGIQTAAVASGEIMSGIRKNLSDPESRCVGVTLVQPSIETALCPDSGRDSFGPPFMPQKGIARGIF